MDDTAIPIELHNVLPPPLSSWRAAQFRDKLVLVSPDHEPLLGYQAGGKWVVMKVDFSKPIEQVMVTADRWFSKTGKNS